MVNENSQVNGDQTSETALSDETAVQNAQLTVRCVVAGDPAIARDYMLYDVRSRRYPVFQRRLAACLGNKGLRNTPGRIALHFSRDALFMFTAENYYALKGAPVLRSDNIAKLQQDRYWADYTPLTRTALCLSGKEPNAVAALLSTGIDSEPEKQALRALFPALPACVESGGSMKISRTALRLRLAYATLLRERME